MSEIRVIGVLGAGQMGGGIAQVAAACGHEVKLADANVDLAKKGRDAISRVLDKQVEKGKMTADAKAALVARIAPVGGPADFAGCDLVIEAATENADLKLRLLRQCDEALAPGAYLASNTSSISLTKLAAGTSRPDRVIGMP